MRIFLIGLPGSGKSTIGRKLAKLLEFEFFDTDDEIIRLEKRSIEDIFQQEGETYFRGKEAEVLKQTILLPNTVISTGGGTPCFFNNMELINQNGVSIFLNVPIQVILRRLKTGRNKNRPMVAGKSDDQLLEFLIAKHKERYPFYSKANIEIDDSEISGESLLKLLRSKAIV